MQPFIAVETTSFQKIFEDIPGIDPPFQSATTYKRYIENEFVKYRSIVKQELAETCQSIALSLDAWTSKNQLSIIAVIGHWLTSKFEYKERVLEFSEIQGDHTGENLAESVENMLIELSLEFKLLTITADNASNNETLCYSLYKNLSKRFDLEFNNIENQHLTLRFQGLNSFVRCLAHILNLVVKQFLSALKTGDIESAGEACEKIKNGKDIPELSALARLRVLILWLARSPSYRKQWKNSCRDASLPERYIEYDVETRWNSVFRMLDQSLQSKRQIFEYLRAYPILPQFSIQDWKRLQQIHKALQRFDEFTRLVSMQSPQISLSLAVYYELSDLLQEIKDRENDFQDFDLDISIAAESAIDKYQKYYSFMDDSSTYYAATVLDPRVKTHLLEHELSKSDAKTLIQGLREELHKLYPSIPEPTPTLSIKPLEPESLESRMFSKLQPRELQTFMSDIDRYFDTPTIPRPQMLAKDKDIWLLSWWNSHKDEYPYMAQIARGFLAIPGSEVSVERLFSGGRDLLGLRRHRMNAETMRMLMLLRDYYLSCM
jgi:hypothetical protein